MRGGDRYGAGRPGWRRKVEHQLRLDLRRLHRDGHLVAGQSMTWQWCREGKQYATIGIRTFSESLKLSYSWTPYGHEPRQIDCNVWLTEVPCNYGGCRRYAICPDCSRLCLVLFGVSRRGNFACRICQRLAYACEAEDPTSRCWRQQRKLEAKLATGFRRPKGMRRKTYQRIRHKWAAIEERKDELFNFDFARLVARLGERATEILGNIS